MVLAGNEQVFNDDGAPWDNTLHSSVIGHYRGTSESYKIGSTLKLGKHWGIGSVVSMNHNLNMEGQLDINLRTLPGLNFGGGEDEDILDPTKIELDEPTKTILKDNPTGEKIVLKFPNSVGVGISGKLWFIGFSFNYLQYSGEYSYEYAIPRENGEKIYKEGFKPQKSLRAGIDLKILRVGAGITTGNIVSSEKADEEEFMLPTLSVGTGLRITKNLSTDFLISAVPSGVGKISINYNL